MVGDDEENTQFLQRKLGGCAKNVSMKRRGICRL